LQSCISPPAFAAGNLPKLRRPGAPGLARDFVNGHLWRPGFEPASGSEH